MAIGLFTLLLTGLSAYSAYDSQQEQAKYNRDQARIQTNINQLKERRAKVASFKEKRRAEANALQAGVDSGANFSSSSGFQGGVSSIGSQFASNESYINQLNTLTEQSLGDKSDIYQAQANAGLFSAGASLFGNTFGGYSEIKDYSKSLFK